MKYLASILLLSLLTVNAGAQITITESDFFAGLNNENNSTSYLATYATYSSVAGLAGVSGANQTWDFTGATYTQAASPGTFTLLPYSDTFPLASDIDFNGASNVIRIVPTNPLSPTTYGFVIVRSDGYFILGTSKDSAGVKTKEDGIYYGEQFAAFPMTYQTTWTSTSAIDAPGATSTERAVITGIVDGYGVLITPSPTTSTPALRSKMQLIYTDTNKTTKEVSTDTQYIYKWYTHSGYTASLITYGSAQTVLSASYSVTAVNSVNEGQEASNDELSLYLTQNPASNSSTKLIYTLPNDGSVKVELMDELGTSVRMLQNGPASAGQNIIEIHPKQFVPGAYFVRMEADGMTGMQELVIQ